MLALGAVELAVPRPRRKAHHWRTHRPPVCASDSTPGCRCPAVPDRLEVSERGRPAGAALESAPGAGPAASDPPLSAAQRDSARLQGVKGRSLRGRPTASRSAARR